MESKEKLGQPKFTGRRPRDSSPVRGGNVKRTFGGYGERTIPVVTQSAFDEEGELTTVDLANTYKGLGPPTPMEMQTHLASQGENTPEQDQKAEQQRRAIRGSIGRQRRKNASRK